MIPVIKASYPHCDSLGCHQVVTGSCYLRDDAPNKCIITQTSNNSTCYVGISNGVIVDFIFIDACLINSATIQKCDIALKSNSVIWFVELKEVIFNGNVKADRNRKIRNAKKAVKQLASTINDFKSKGIDLSNYNVAALISFPPYISEPSPISIPTTATQSRINELSNLCGYANLYEGNHIIFT